VSPGADISEKKLSKVPKLVRSYLYWPPFLRLGSVMVPQWALIGRCRAEEVIVSLIFSGIDLLRMILHMMDWNWPVIFGFLRES